MVELDLLIVSKNIMTIINSNKNKLKVKIS